MLRVNAPGAEPSAPSPPVRVIALREGVAPRRWPADCARGSEAEARRSGSRESAERTGAGHDSSALVASVRADGAGSAGADCVAVDPPGDDPVGADADQRSGLLDRLRATADRDPSRPPRIRAREVVEDERRAPAPLDVAVLLRPREVVPADVDRVTLRVVALHPHRHHVGRAVPADGRDAGQPPLPGHVGELPFGEDAHLQLRRRRRPRSRRRSGAWSRRARPSDPSCRPGADLPSPWHSPGRDAPAT